MGNEEFMVIPSSDDELANGQIFYPALNARIDINNEKTIKPYYYIPTLDNVGLLVPSDSSINVVDETFDLYRSTTIMTNDEEFAELNYLGAFIRTMEERFINLLETNINPIIHNGIYQCISSCAFNGAAKRQIAEIWCTSNIFCEQFGRVIGKIIADYQFEVEQSMKNKTDLSVIYANAIAETIAYCTKTISNCQFGFINKTFSLNLVNVDDVFTSIFDPDDMKTVYEVTDRYGAALNGCIELTKYDIEKVSEVSEITARYIFDFVRNEIERFYFIKNYRDSNRN